MPAVGVYDQINKAFQDIVAPEIHSLRGHIERLDGRIVAVETKIDAADGRLTARIDALDGKLAGFAPRCVP